MAEENTSQPIQEKQEIKQQVTNLTNKLKRISHQYPQINIQSKVKPQQSSRLKSSQIQRSSWVTKQFGETNKRETKQKINWNHSAQAWTREKSPSHSIPRSKRFIQPKPVNMEASEVYPELYIDLRTKFGQDSKKVSFAKSLRPKLFTIQPNPSPNFYQTRRYLQVPSMSPKFQSRQFQRSRVNPQTQMAETFYHIKGGTMNRFDNHQLLYYPHTKKLNYNDKLIRGLVQEKKMFESQKGQSFRVRKSNNNLSFNS